MGSPELFIKSVDRDTFEDAFWTLYDEEGSFFALLLAIVHVDKVPKHIKSPIMETPPDYKHAHPRWCRGSMAVFQKEE